MSGPIPPPPGYPPQNPYGNAYPNAYGNPYAYPYENTYSPYGSAKTLVFLAGIFMAICGACSLLSAIGWGIGSGILAAQATDTEEIVGSIVMGSLAACALIAAPLQGVAAVKLLKKRPTAARWALIGGIASCVDLWCYIACVVPLGFGVFSIVVGCLSNVRAYLAAGAPDRAAFPVQGQP